jgi:hypothetical protein
MSPTTPAGDKPDQEVSLFVKYVWFWAFFFFCMVMIASFGTIAET